MEKLKREMRIIAAGMETICARERRDNDMASIAINKPLNRYRQRNATVNQPNSMTKKHQPRDVSSRAACTVAAPK